MKKSLICMVGILPVTLWAATVSWIGTGGSNIEANGSWDTAGAGVGDYNTLGDLSANDFVINQAFPFQQAQINGTSNGQTFNGQSVTVTQGTLASRLGNEVGAGASSFTFGDVIMGSGSILRFHDAGAAASTDVTLNGNFEFQGNNQIFFNQIQSNAGVTKTSTVNGTVSGSGNINLIQSGFSYSGAGALNTFVLGDATSSWNGSLDATSGVDVLANAELVIDFGWDVTGSSLAMDDHHKLNLDSDMAFRYVNLNGVNLTGQTWTYAELDAAGFGDFFVDNGGTLTVFAVPEPSTFGLLGMGVVLLRNRLQKRKR